MLPGPRMRLVFAHLDRFWCLFEVRMHMIITLKRAHVLVTTHSHTGQAFTMRGQGC